MEPTKGRGEISREKATVGLFGLAHICLGCEEQINYGEDIDVITMRGSVWRFHPNCLTQFVTYLNRYIEMDSNGGRFN